MPGPTGRVTADRRAALAHDLGAPIFFPQDLDALSRTTTLSFALKRPMTVTWTSGTRPAPSSTRRWTRVAEPAGTYTWAFDGRAADGTMLPRGRYTSYVTATEAR